MKNFSPLRWWQPLALVCLTLLLACPARAQLVPQYTFSTSTATYTPLTGGTTFSINGGGGDTDDGKSAPLALPFPVSLGGFTSSSVIVSTNGWLTLAPSADAGVLLQVLNKTQDQLVAFFARDLNQAGATFSYLTSGTAPNRIWKMQGANIGQFGQIGSQGNVQVWLYESGAIELHYGAFNGLFTTPSFTFTQVGLRGTGTADVRSVTGTWAAPVASTSATADLPLSATDVPVNGSVFRFDPPAGVDITPPTIGAVTLTPPGGACAPAAHVVAVTPTDASGIASASLSYTVNGGTPVVLPMTNAGGTYSATIPAQGGALVTYTVRVVDASAQANAAATAPAAYADGQTTVTAGPDRVANAGTALILTATENPDLGLKITEMEIGRFGTGRTSPLPAYIGATDVNYVEISNTGSARADLSGYRFELKSAAPGVARTYTFLAGTTLAPGAVLVLHIGPGTDSPANNYYHIGGASTTLFSGDDAGFLLLNPNGVAIDGVPLNNFNAAANFPPGVWSGAGVSVVSGVAGAALLGADTNTNANWTAATAAVALSTGTLNTGLPLRPTPTVTWTGGNLSGPVTANPLTTPTFATPGTVTFTASLTQNGCTVTDDLTVTVIAPQTPAADFAASATSVPNTTVVTFTDLSTNLPSGWLWSFSPASVTFVNGTSATSQNPQVLFNGAGCYTVTLAASNPAGTDTETKTAYVCVQLNYCSANLQSSACSSFSAPINSVSIAGTTLSNLNNGCSDAAGLSYSVFPASGATTASLTVGQTYNLTVTSASSGTVAAWLDTNANGVFEPSEYILVASAGMPPTPSTSTVAFTVPASAVTGQVRLRIRNSASGSPTGTIADTDACVLRFTGETEDYTLTLAGGCSIPTPVPASNAPICAGDSLSFSATNVPVGANYAWTGPNGFTSAAAAPMVPNATAAASGTYSLIVTVNGCSSAVASVTVTVRPAQSAAFAYSASSYCLNAANPTPTITGTSGGTFSATTGLTLNATTGAINLATSTAGTYAVTYTTAGPCAATSTQTVTLNLVPTVAITGLNPAYCSADAAVTLSGTVNGTVGGSFTLNGTAATQLDPGALGAGAPVTVTVVFTGTTAGGCAATVSQTVTINPTPAPPTITVTPQASGIVLLTSSAPTGNQWYFNGLAIAGATGVGYAVTTSAQNGSYTVGSTAAPCPAPLSAPQSVTVTGTVADAAQAAGFALYPNPTPDGLLHLELPAAASPQPLTVLDGTGRVVYRALLPANVLSHSLDLRTLPLGVYSVRVVTPVGPAVRRLLRE